MSEGDPLSWNPNRRKLRHSLETTPMMKKILLSAATLSVVALGAASPASAKSNFSLYIGTPWLSAYSYDYPSSCTYESRLVTIKVPNGYGGYYFKKVWRDIRVCY
ncbi:MAG: hypothetical protein MUO37_04540 [Methyloceanibacter sp.]|nr:hypothetical protein [Methyloceanibacter sp.]